MSESIKNTNPDRMSESYGMGKLSKDVEINESMSVKEQGPDEMTKAIETLKGGI